jgi:hypothetical protein
VSAANEQALIKVAAALATRRAAADAINEAGAAFKRATEEFHDAQLAAILTIDCPYAPCGAKVGERCWGEGPGDGRHQLGKLAQHGIRADVAGVHGHESRAHALRILARTNANQEN